MRKLIFVLVMVVSIFLFITYTACAQTTIFVESGTLAWDASLDENGNVIPAVELAYEIYESHYPVGDPQNPSAHTLLGSTISTEYSIFVGVTRTAFGVRAIRTNDGDVLYSELAWSYVEADADPAIGPWVARWLPRPDKPKKLRVQ